MGRRRALLIATYEYRDAGLRQLTSPAHDAEALAAVLSDPDVAGFDVTVMVNEPHHLVGPAIGDFFRDRSRDELALLYFSGHGLKDDRGQLYLATSDTRRDSLLFTAVAAEAVDQAMEGCVSRQKILVLDCCYSGAYPAGRLPKADTEVHTLERFQGRGRTVLTASDSTQYAFDGNRLEGDAAPQSVFTRYLVEGLRDGSADLDGDGDITVDELYTYVHDRVVAEMPQQRPKKLDNVQGRTVLARNVNWTLPAYLHHALASPLAADRLAALDGLDHLYRVGNATVRDRVEAEFRRLADDDSKTVSIAAAARLAPRQPRPTEPEQGEPESGEPEPGTGPGQAASTHQEPAVAHANVLSPSPARPATVTATAPPQPTPTPQTEPSESGEGSSPSGGDAPAAVSLKRPGPRTGTASRRPASASSLPLSHRFTAWSRNGRTRLLAAAVALVVAAGAVTATILLSGETDDSTDGGTETGAGPPTPPGMAISPDGNWLYVTVNHASRDGGPSPMSAVVPVDTSTGATGTPFGFGPGAGDAVIGPEGKPLYVASHDSGQGVTVVFELGADPVGINGIDFTDAAAYDREGNRSLALSSDGGRIYLADEPTSTVLAADVDSIALAGSILVGSVDVIEVPGGASGLVRSPDDSRLYVAGGSTTSAGIVSVVDTTSNTVVATVTVGNSPRSVAVSQDGTRLYVANYGSDTISVVDTATDMELDQFHSGCTYPANVAVGNDGTTVYTTCGTSSVVTVHNATGDQLAEPIDVGLRPSTMLLSPDGARLYVANNDGDTIEVTAIDTATNTVDGPPFVVGNWLVNRTPPASTSAGNSS